MGIKFKSPLQLSAHRSIAHSDTAKTLIVKVITKTAAHPEHGNGSSSGYTIDGVEGAYLELTPGNTYKFDQSDNSNASHPLRFYEEANKTTAYTTGVTTNGTAGSSGAYTQIIPTTSTPPILFYQCSSHSLMGSYVKFGTGTIGDTYSINVATDGNNVDLNLDAASGTDSTVQLTAGSNVSLTRNNAQEVTIASANETYDLNATQDGNNVDINLTSTSGNDNSTVQLTAGSNVTLTRNGAQEVTIAASGGSQGITIQEEGSALSTLATTLNFTGSNVTASGTGTTKTINVTGGGSGTITVEKNVYTANGSTAAFNTTTAIVSENNVQVYIDGVYQSKDDYTTSGSTVTLDSNPANGAIVELIHMVAISGVIATDSFTGNGSTTAYVLSMSISNENATQVYLDGVYQSKNNYSTSGSTLTFSTAPSNGTAIEVVHLKAVNATSINQNSFTGDGSDTTFTLSQAIDDENKTFVFIQGVYQEKSTYSISGTTLTFSTAPQNGYTIEVMAFDSVTIGGPTVSAIDWQSTVQTSNFTAATGRGYFVNTTSGAVTVSLPAGNAGDEIHFTDYASNFDTNELILSANGSEKILGETDDHKCITKDATVRLIYQNDTKGWTADNIATTAVAVTVHYLVVAGGGGGGHVGGGGAGGYRTNNGGTALTLQPSTNYTVTVGAGGNASTSTSSPANASSGNNSVFATITSAGGGYGGANVTSHTNGIAADGGSGGGGGWDGSDADEAGGSGNTPNTVPSQGNDGGQGGYAHPYYAGGGGGGAGAVGADMNVSGQAVGGAGGDGLANSISGSSVTYAGGGGGQAMQWVGGASGRTGGAGGSGGGGQGGGSTTPTDGGTNLGGGGGSPGYTTSGVGAGGSGVVILSYPSALTLTVPGGLTSSTATVGSNKVTTFTAGTGNITFG